MVQSRPLPPKMHYDPFMEGTVYGSKLRGSVDLPPRLATLEPKKGTVPRY
jgi:hypothetical protein